ncbi:hypothetical protein [Zoogloea sp.]|uniref:hypothetical protein n=1 Tax=Zoogloea sp. TaxID=49181 RepID=UPI001AC34CE4|nr:hypothetical protein [Zoogloea sp.]MBN8281948.1 hypothetical protein [Zoogloea sp.]
MNETRNRLAVGLRSVMTKGRVAALALVVPGVALAQTAPDYSDLTDAITTAVGGITALILAVAAIKAGPAVLQWAIGRVLSMFGR